MDTYTFMFKTAIFEALMKGKGGPVTDTDLFARIARVNREGHHVRIIDEATDELIHEFLPKSQSNESSATPNSDPEDPKAK
jgi:hypothetical protein